MTHELDQLPADLIVRTCAGDVRAADTLLGAMQRPVYNLALRMLNDRTAAEDATQVCLLRVFTRLSSYRAEARFSTWVFCVATNAILDFRGGLARTAQRDFEAFERTLLGGLDAGASERPEQALLLKQAKALCSRALLQCLDGDHRIAFVLGEILELDAESASAVLDVPAATYRKRLSRARGALTLFLERTCSVHSENRACACHRRVGAMLDAGRIDPAQLESRIGDLEAVRRRLVVLEPDARTTGAYRADELPDLRDDVLSALRTTLVRIVRPPTFS